MLRLGIALWLLGAAGQDPAAHLLQWKLAKGQAFRYELIQKTELMIGTVPITHSLVYGLAVEVARADDPDRVDLHVTVDHGAIKMTGPMACEYDSAKDKKPPEALPARVMAAIVGTRLTVQVDRAGRFLAWEGIAKTVASIMEKADKEEPLRVQIVSGVFGDESLKRTLESHWGLLPKDGVKAGAAWEADGSLPIPMLGRLVLKHRMTAKEFRDSGREAVIEQATQVDLEADEEHPAGEAELVDSSSKGERSWLVEKGMLQASQSTLKMEFTLGSAELVSTTRTELKLAPKK